MLRKAFPIDSHVEFEADGTPIYDRAITSAPLRKLIKSLVTDGVLPNPSTNMQVSAGSGMNVLVEAGFALCNGCMAMEESQRTLAVQASDTTYDRIDTVVLRLNDNDSERTCDLYVLQGVPASTPIRPTLTRTESIWEIGLADLFITPHSAEITNQRITDTRYETERCGVISAISEFDTTTLYNQVQADLVGFKEEEQAQFVEWFDYMKNQLSEDAAGNLQLQINDTNEKIGVLENLTTSVKDTIVGAINWLKDQLDALVKRVSKNETDISALNSNIEACGTILWENPDKTSSFSQLSVDLSSKEWKMALVVYECGETYPIIRDVDDSITIRRASRYSSDSKWLPCWYARKLTVSNNIVTFHNGTRINSGASASSDSNAQLIPIRIIRVL